MSVDIERYSSSGLVGVNLKMGNEFLSFPISKSFKSSGVNNAEIGFDISFKFFSRELSCNNNDFGVGIIFSSRISESSWLINPFEIIHQLGEF